MPLFPALLSAMLPVLELFTTSINAFGCQIAKTFPLQKSQKPHGKEEKADPVEKITVEDLFRRFEEVPLSDMAPCTRLWEIFNTFFLQTSVNHNLISLKELALAGDGTPMYTTAQERKTRTCKCLEKAIHYCKCNRIYHQPDCDSGWDSHRNRYYFGYDLYMPIAADSANDLPVFPFLSPASRHDSHEFLYNWFSMKQMLILSLKNSFSTQPTMLCLIAITVKLTA